VASGDKISEYSERLSAEAANIMKKRFFKLPFNARAPPEMETAKRVSPMKRKRREDVSIEWLRSSRVSDLSVKMRAIGFNRSGLIKSHTRLTIKQKLIKR
jgi:hypothetical protein